MRRQTFRQPIDALTHIDVSGMCAPVTGTIVNVSLSGCRLRSWILLERGASVEFEWQAPQLPLVLRGTIVARSRSNEGPAFEYAVRFTEMTQSESDTLARQIAVSSPSTAGEERRNAYCARFEFPVDVRFEDRSKSLTALATDVSSGGLRLVCDDELAPGERIVVRFRLREELQIRSRVRGRLGDGRGRPAFAVDFVEIDAYTREEIARFIQAAQVRQMRPAG